MTRTAMEKDMATDHDAKDRSELKSRLQELHNQLESATKIHPEEKDLLSNMIVGILRLEEQSSNLEIESDWTDLLEEKSLVYEAQYPKVAFTLRQILDILSRMGI
jgi:hypothetical protein